MAGAGVAAYKGTCRLGHGHAELVSVSPYVHKYSEDGLTTTKHPCLLFIFSAAFLAFGKFVDAFADAAHQLGNLTGAKQQQDHSQYQHDFKKTKTHNIRIGVKGENKEIKDGGGCFDAGPGRMGNGNW